MPGGVSLAFLDAPGAVIRTFRPRPGAPPAPPADGGAAPGSEATATASEAGPREERAITARPGLNRFVWDLRYPGAEKVPGDVTTERAVTGPLAPPGTYQARLTVGDQSWTRSFEIRKDPRVTATQADLDAQFALWIRVRDSLSQAHAGDRPAPPDPAPGERVEPAARRSASPGRDGGETPAPDERLEAVSRAAGALTAKLSAIEAELIQTEARNSMDSLRLPARLNLRLASLVAVLSSADAAPTRQAGQVYEDLAEKKRPTRGDAWRRHAGTGLLMLWTDVDPEHEAAFNRWYDEEHLARLLAVPGSSPPARYVALRGGPKYLAMYELEDVATCCGRRRSSTRCSFRPVAGRAARLGRRIGRNYLLNGYRQIFPLQTEPDRAHAWGHRPTSRWAASTCRRRSRRSSTTGTTGVYIPTCLTVPGCHPPAALRRRRRPAQVSSPCT